MAYAELVSSVAAAASATVSAVLSSPRQIVAFIALALGVGMVVAGAFSRTMLPLRWFAAGSEAMLITYGALRPSLTTLVIAAVLLPINILRAIEMTRLTRQVTRAQVEADLAGLWLKPYMKSRKLKAGETLFRKGDRANRLYLLVDGEMELKEIGKRLTTGLIFGEIALFSPDRLRTNTAHCLTDCTLLQIHEKTVRQLFFQNPAFGFHLMELLARRLGADLARQNEQRAEALRATNLGP